MRAPDKDIRMIAGVIHCLGRSSFRSTNRSKSTALVLLLNCIYDNCLLTRIGVCGFVVPKAIKKSSCQRNRCHSSFHSSTTLLTMSSVIVVGSANQDLVAYTDKVPVLGETVLGNDFETSCGGKGANQAVAAAALVPTRMVCKVGQDPFGQVLLKNFDRVGVDWDKESVHAEPGVPTGVAPIIVDSVSGDNSIIVIPGANHALSPTAVQQALHANAPSPQPDHHRLVVLVQLEITKDSALEAMKVAKQDLGATTILNPAPVPPWGLEEIYPFVDILVPNESELRVLCGVSPDDTSADEQELAKSLLDKSGVGEAIVVTLGSRGAMVVTKDGSVSYVSAPDGLPWNDDPVVDTVGAGDCFCGSLAAYLSSSMDLSSSARLACGMASRSVRHRGAQSSFFTRKDDIPTILRLPSSSQETATAPETQKPVITFVTGNKKKLEEVQRILLSGEEQLPFTLTNKKVDLPELQGEPLEIAEEKCRLAAQDVDGPVLTEDTSLCFHALNGMPGPYIKWFLEKCGHAGLNKMLDGFDDRSAYAHSIFAFTEGPNQPVHLLEGRTEGRIVPARGPKDFGWDPVFEPLEGEGGKTYAELSKDAKNTISHRGKAMVKLQALLNDQYGKG